MNICFRMILFGLIIEVLLVLITKLTVEHISCRQIVIHICMSKSYALAIYMAKWNIYFQINCVLN
jgi:hypothetical protein